MNSIRPIKSLSQNYLKDLNTIKKVVHEFDPKEDDTIFEIGPGTGALSKELIKVCNNLTGIELDERVIDQLRNELPEVKIIHADFLKLDLVEKAENNKIRLFGNIPFKITAPILFKFIENSNVVSDAGFIMQYEVAERISAKPGTKKYGILSVILNYYCDCKLSFKISKNVFFPKPKVDSAFVLFKFRNENLEKPDKQIFIQTVKACFGNRRKSLKNSLSNSIFGDCNFESCGVDLSLRAEQLTIEDFVTLAKFIERVY